MAVCNADELMESAKCFACLPKHELIALQTQLLYEIAGSAQTVQQLIDAATTNGFMGLQPNQALAVQNQLLCDLV